MGRTETVDGWLLRHHDFKETDRVVVLLTREQGLLRAVAKGVKKPKSRLAGRLTPFCENRILLAYGRGMPVISQLDTVQRHQKILEDFDRLAAALAANELLLVLLAEQDVVTEICDRYDTFLQGLPKAKLPEALLIAFELLLLDSLGYRPELEQCQGCGAVLTEATIRGISEQWGGLGCKRCIPPGKLLRLTSGEWNLLLRFQEFGLPMGLEWDDATPLPQLRQALRILMTGHAERELRAERMFDWGRSPERP